MWRVVCRNGPAILNFSKFSGLFPQTSHDATRFL